MQNPSKKAKNTAVGTNILPQKAKVLPPPTLLAEICLLYGCLCGHVTNLQLHSSWTEFSVVSNFVQPARLKKVRNLVMELPAEFLSGSQSWLGHYHL